MVISSELQTFIDCCEYIERAFLGSLMGDETCIGNKLILVFGSIQRMGCKVYILTYLSFTRECHVLIDFNFFIQS